MKFTANRTAVVKALAATAPARAGRTAAPALKTCKVEAVESGDLTFSATDTEVSIRLTVAGATVHRTGACLVDPDRLATLLKGSDAPDVEVSADDKGVLIRSGRGKFTLTAPDVNEFPDPDWSAGAEAVSLPAGTLLDLAAQGGFAEPAAALEKGIPGTLIDVGGGRVRFAATDTVCLSVATAAAPEDAPAASAVVPGKALAVLAGVLSDRGESVRVAVGGGRVAVVTDRVAVATQVLARKFYDFDRIVPKKQSNAAELPLAAFGSAVGQAAVLTDPELNRLSLSFAPGRLVVAARNPNTGGGEVEIPLPDYAGGEVKLLLDAGNLKKMLALADRHGLGAAAVEFTSGVKPVVFRFGADWTVLMMPMSAD